MPGVLEHTHTHDYIGQQFGWLTVIANLPDRRVKHGTNRVVLCRCACGREHPVYVGSLTAGRTRSCGCMHYELIAEKKRTHGLCRSREFVAWVRAKQRCENPNATQYAYYGGRGITVCERWRHSFVNFIADMGMKPSPKHSLDRIDPNGNYEKTNCRWATWNEQRTNQRRSRHP